MKILSALFFLSLSFIPFVHAKPGIGFCRSNGPFNVCDTDQSEGRIFMIDYNGYLKDSGKKVYIQGEIDGEPFREVLNTYGPGQNMFQLVSRHDEETASTLVIYAVDSEGNYDSNFGQNYYFQLQ